jgi:putative spermidine/putrescine transport system substrate-binding protein
LGYTPARADLDPKQLPGEVPYGEAVVNALHMADWKKIVNKMDLWKERWAKEIAR